MKNLRIRIKLAWVLFLILLCWPMIHILLTTRGYFSPWRLAGWGMYSTPYPEEFSAIRVFICICENDNKGDFTEKSQNQLKSISSYLRQRDSTGKESPLLEIYKIDDKGDVQPIKLSWENFSALRPQVSGILQLSRGRYLQYLIKEILVLSPDIKGLENLSAMREKTSFYAIISEQRLQRERAYLNHQSFLVDVMDKTVHQLAMDPHEN